VRSNNVTFGFASPYIGNVVNTVQLDADGVVCPFRDPVENRTIGTDERRDMFLLSVRGFNFGPPRADGRGPLDISGGGSSAASLVSVVVQLQPGVSAPVNFTVPCFERWDHNVIEFTVPAYPGVVHVTTTSVGVDGTTWVQVSNAVSFQYNSPALRSNENGGEIPLVRGDGTSVLRVVGQFLFTENSTAEVTRVTVGGITGGMPVDPARVTMGVLPAAGSGRRLASAPTQFIDITVPPWQVRASP
jgi:hypothetical protein